MRKVEEHELEQINGGFSWGVAAGIVAGVVFIIGIIDGYVNPQKCNN